MENAAGNKTEQILNYNFNQVEFAPDENGNLMLTRKQNGLSCAEKIGDYPTIPSEEAAKPLLNGNYITSVPEKNARKKTCGKNQFFLPYYRFWVDLPDSRLDNSLKTYGAYYVPSVQQRYISKMPLWGSSFN
jgi:hypothetical protein